MTIKPFSICLIIITLFMFGSYLFNIKEIKEQDVECEKRFEEFKESEYNTFENQRLYDRWFRCGWIATNKRIYSVMKLYAIFFLSLLTISSTINKITEKKK